ncbi:Dephospho-CoA kinase [hydrothermal vent metagenome]|uniref:Dephospho-CoA kinase n=1 Tax=hydrothermal vent metagenome TaxID=652676 RepID=A0A3B0WR55_9ZZZZ
MKLKKNLPPPLIIGLTGGIGSGKSTVSQILSEYHIPTIDTDLISRQLVTPHSTGLNAIVQQFGKRILNPDATLNRRVLREIIFNDNTAKQQLEAILHPMIQTEVQKQISQLKQNSPPPLILVAIPLLAESIKKDGQRPDYIHQIWVVDSSVEQQIKQASQRDNSPPEQIQKIINQQASRKERLAIADVVIHNNGDISHLKKQLKNIVSKEANSTAI